MLEGVGWWLFWQQLKEFFQGGICQLSSIQLLSKYLGDCFQLLQYLHLWALELVSFVQASHKYWFVGKNFTVI
jgi:hypothetical protein